MFSYMANEKSNKKLVATNLGGPDTDRLGHLVEWAEIIHKDLAAFIEALDRFYMEKNSAGKPASKDFLTAVNSNKE